VGPQRFKCFYPKAPQRKIDSVLMQIQVLIGFVVALAALSGQVIPSTVRAGWLTGVAAVVYLVVAAALAQAGVIGTLRALGPARPVGGPDKRYRALLLTEKLWLLGGYAGLLACGYVDWIGNTLGLTAFPLLGLWVAVLPFAVALLISWAIGYRVHMAIRQCVIDRQPPTETPLAVWTRGQYVRFQLRTHLLFVAIPLSLIVLVGDVLDLYVRPMLAEPTATWVLAGGTVAAAGAVFLTAPLLIVLIWRTDPLPPGPLRDQLESLCRRLKLRYRRILIWRSYGVLANAGVMGLIAPVRYILLSDALLERSDRRHVLAVFAHEAAHVVGHHIFYAGLFAVSAALLAGAGATGLADVLGWDYRLAEAATLPWLIAAWVAGFGWLSRRFERQCDVVGAWVLSKDGAVNGDPIDVDWTDPRISTAGAATFASALERVATLNGTPLHQPNWRHGSIAWRVHHLMELAALGGTRRAIDRIVRRIKAALWAALAVAVMLNAILVLTMETPS